MSWHTLFYNSHSLEQSLILCVNIYCNLLLSVQVKSLWMIYWSFRVNSMMTHWKVTPIMCFFNSIKYLTVFHINLIQPLDLFVFVCFKENRGYLFILSKWYISHFIRSINGPLTQCLQFFTVFSSWSWVLASIVGYTRNAWVMAIDWRVLHWFNTERLKRIIIYSIWSILIKLLHHLNIMSCSSYSWRSTCDWICLLEVLNIVSRKMILSSILLSSYSFRMHLLIHCYSFIWNVCFNLLFDILNFINILKVFWHWVMRVGHVQRWGLELYTGQKIIFSKSFKLIFIKKNGLSIINIPRLLVRYFTVHH